MGDGLGIGQQDSAGHGCGEQHVAARDVAREARTNMFITALLEWNGGSSPVTVRNLSASGALVEAGSLPPIPLAEGSTVRLVRGGLAASGTAVWCDGRRCGIRLDGTVAVALWMAKPGNVTQAEIDEAVRQFKAGGAVPLGGAALASAPTTEQVSARQTSLAERVRELEALLLAVSDDLAADPATVARHAGELQKLDLLAQGLARLRG